MARTRNISPRFFENEEIAELSLEARLLFIALWTIADREGRLEDRPKRIKIKAFPYDDFNIDEILEKLASKKFILRYEINGEKFIQIINFHKNQKIHPQEAASCIPSPKPINSDYSEKYEKGVRASEINITNNPSISEPSSSSCTSETTTTPLPPCGDDEVVVVDFDKKEKTETKPQGLNVLAALYNQKPLGKKLFTIKRNEKNLTEERWLVECLCEMKSLAPLDIPLADLLGLHPSLTKIYNRWIEITMPERMAAYVYTVLHSNAKQELPYAISVVRKRGFGSSEYLTYLETAQQSVASNDYEVAING